MEAGSSSPHAGAGCHSDAQRPVAAPEGAVLGPHSALAPPPALFPAIRKQSLLPRLAGTALEYNAILEDDERCRGHVGIDRRPDKNASHHARASLEGREECRLPAWPPDLVLRGRGRRSTSECWPHVTNAVDP